MKNLLILITFLTTSVFGISSLNPITAGEIIKDYEENELNADSKYKDKNFKIIGYVESVKKDYNGKYYISITYKGGYGGIHAYVDNKNLKEIIDFKKDDMVIVQGKCYGKEGFIIFERSTITKVKKISKFCNIEGYVKTVIVEDENCYLLLAEKPNCDYYNFKVCVRDCETNKIHKLNKGDYVSLRCRQVLEFESGAGWFEKAKLIKTMKKNTLEKLPRYGAITLKSGKVYYGRLIERTNKGITIKTDIFKAFYKWDKLSDETVKKYKLDE